MNESGVYIIECQGLYKIGVSGCVANRMKALGAASPFDLTLVSILDSTVPYALEKRLHRTFASKAVQGEWFALDEEDIDVARAIALAFPEQEPFEQLSLFEIHVDSHEEIARQQIDETPENQYWICPACGFLTQKPGLCDICRESGVTSIISRELKPVV